MEGQPDADCGKYLQWADNFQENQITIIYDTMWNATRRMAETIAEGISEADPKATVKIFSASKTDKTDIITEVFRSRAVLAGSPTVNNGYLYSIAGILELIRGMKFKNKGRGFQRATAGAASRLS